MKVLIQNKNNLRRNLLQLLNANKHTLIQSSAYSNVSVRMSPCQFFETLKGTSTDI